MSKVKRELQTIKYKGRKFLVVHRSATCLLLKRAGKILWFTLVDGKAGKLDRHRDFWAALEAHKVNMETRGVELHNEALQEVDEGVGGKASMIAIVDDYSKGIVQ